MKIPGHFLFLGTGGSMGIPVIGCHCRVCTSDSPCNQRLRPSGLVTIENKKLLIDCGPDFRLQALRHHLDTLDGLLLTHAHHDHIAGIDELRIYYMRSKTPLPCLLSNKTAADLRARYSYIFDTANDLNKLTSRLALQEIVHPQGMTTFEGIPIGYMTYEQGGMLVNGFRFGNFAYVSDIRHYPENIFESLKGVEILVLSALRHTPSYFHFSIDEAIAFAKRAGAKQTWLTHIAHDLEHEETNAYLPSNVRMAYDGLELNFHIDIDRK
jgi:phosphoribosyl 1,2-cyclic phosphate phosphodiesterase